MPISYKHTGMQQRLNDEFNDVYMQCKPEDTSAEEVDPVSCEYELPCMFILSLTNMHAITMSWRVQPRLQVAYLKACMLKKWTTYIIMWSTWGYEYFIKCSYDYNTNADIKHGTVSSTLSTSFHFICICSTIQLFAMNVSSSQRLLKGLVLDHSFEWFNT